MTDFSGLIATVAAKHGLPAALVSADVQHESGGNAFAIGDDGLAVGLMQVHPAACTEVGANWQAIHDAITSRNEIVAATLGLEAGCAYLAKMMGLFGDQAWALGAYNQGETVIRRAKAYADAVAEIVRSGSTP